MSSPYEGQTIPRLPNTATSPQQQLNSADAVGSNLASVNSQSHNERTKGPAPTHNQDSRRLKSQILKDPASGKPLRVVFGPASQSDDDDLASSLSGLSTAAMPPMLGRASQRSHQQFDGHNVDEDAEMPPLAEGGHNDENAHELNEEQQNVVNLIMQGRNVFYTGSAGCGKSTVLKAAVARLRKANKTVHIVAPTGKAALGVKGMTTWSYLGWSVLDKRKSMEELQRKQWVPHIQQRIRNTDVLIIDEISMVENHHLERMNWFMKGIRDWGLDEEHMRPFGGVQMIVSGDFCQLSPVKPFQYCPECGQETTINEDDKTHDCPDKHGPWHDDDQWAFRSSAWQECNFVSVNLTTVHRQTDTAFIRMLQKRRLGIPLSTYEVDVLMNHPCNVVNATQLYPKKGEVKEINDTKFRQMKTPTKSYRAIDNYHPNGNEIIPSHLTARFSDGTLEKLKEHQFESKVELRAGMLVVLLTNLNVQGGLVNGSTGIICGYELYDPNKLPTANRGSFSPSMRPTINGEYALLMEDAVKKFAESQEGPKEELMWPIVRFLDIGEKRVIYPHCSVSYEGARQPFVLLHRTQLPLMPAWALTIHKAQGMTLSRVIIDLSRAFETQQIYVALSRAKSLEGLKITGGRMKLEIAAGGNPVVQQFLVGMFGPGVLNLADQNARPLDRPN